MEKIKYAEIKIGNSTPFIYDNGVFKERKLNIKQKNKNFVADSITELIVFMLFWKISGFEYAMILLSGSYSGKITRYLLNRKDD